MDAREDGGVRTDPAGEGKAASTEAGDGDLAALEPAGTTSVDFGQGATGLGGGDLIPPHLSGSAAGDRANNFSDPGPVGDLGPPNLQLQLGAERVGLRARLSALAARRAASHGPEQEQDPPGVVAVRDFQPRHGGGGARGGMMRSAAFLAISLAVMALIASPDAPARYQFRALMILLGGCVLLYLSRH